MAFKIDPDAASLYKELRPIHSAFKKAIKQESAEKIARVFDSVFGSVYSRFSVTDKHLNTHEDVVWVSPIRALSISAVFNAKVTVHLDDDANATSADMQDQWIYGALLPLTLKMDLHDAWKDILIHCAQLLSKPLPKDVLLFNVWDEKMLIESLGWLPDEGPADQGLPVNDQQYAVFENSLAHLSLCIVQIHCFFTFKICSNNLSPKWVLAYFGKTTGF